MPKQENAIVLMNGEITIFQREESKRGIYYVRVKDKDGTAIIKSTKTSNIDIARNFAFDFLIEVKGKIKQGIVVKSPSVADCYKSWINDFWSKDDRYDENALNTREANKKDNRFKLITYQFKKYILPFMGKLNVSSINSRLIVEYCIHRSNYYKENPEKQTPLTKITPSITTIKMELTAIRQLLNYALAKGYVKELPLFKIPEQAVKLAPKRVRSGVSKEEFDKLMEYEKNGFKIDGEGKTLDKRHLAQRRLICRLLEFISLTYLRAGEALNLKWSDLSIFTNDEGQRFFKISVRDGKTGAREVIAQTYIIWCLQGLKEITGSYEYIFCDPNSGKRLENPNKTIRTMFSEIGINRTIVLYDFRHYGITQALLMGNDIYDISLNAGTSVSHIESTYSKVLVIHKAQKLSRSRVGPMVVGAENTEPVFDLAVKTLGDLIKQE